MQLQIPCGDITQTANNEYCHEHIDTIAMTEACCIAEW